jgi:hypothetical protein
VIKSLYLVVGQKENKQQNLTHQKGDFQNVKESPFFFGA